MGLHSQPYDHVNGLLDRKKRIEIFALAKAKNIVLFLQETHVHYKKIANIFYRDWVSAGFWSYGISNQQCSVGILFHTKLKYKVLSYYHNVVGRYIIVNISIEDQHFCLINIYTPMDIKDRKEFLNGGLSHSCSEEFYLSWRF